ncbi:MAG: MerR family transcriptional regulator [Deltaproteobacteria bacterium]|nr:MerR family transcriptional regulator [Deltaproteobacteria bacterium]
MAVKRKESRKRPDNQEGMTIKEVAEKADLTPRTIRYYEEIGILNAIKRDPYNRRRYTQTDLYRLKLTKRAKDILHLSLDDIKELQKHYRNEDPEEKLMIRDSINVIKMHVQMIDDQLNQFKLAKKTLMKEIKRLESLSKQRGHEI